jgi:hypothetical protein
MLELLFFFGMLTLGAVLLIGFLKLLVVLLILPFKLAWWAAKGIVGLLLFIPLIVVFFLVFTNVFPLLLILMILPVLLVVAGVGMLMKLVFC